MTFFAPRRIAVVVTRQIGDVLLTTPLISAAAERWPAARIDVVGFAGTLGVLEGNPHVVGRIELPAKLRAADAWRFVRTHGRRHDLVLIAEASDRAHLVGLLLGATRAGLVPADASHAWWKRRLLRHSVEVGGDRSDRHVADEKLALLAPWRGPDAAVPPVRAPDGAPLPDAVASLIDERSTVVVHAPSMWAYKQWPAERYAEVCAALLDDGHTVVLTGSASPRDRGIVDAVVADVGMQVDAAAATRLVDAAGLLDFRQLATLLRRAALYVGPDGSVTHLAAACATPVVAVFGPTDPRRWGPIDGSARHARVDASAQRRGRVLLLQGPTAGVCVPCGRAGCDDHRDSRSACLDAIDAPRVVAAARVALRGRATASA